MRYELYLDRRDKFRWRLVADNGRILAVSSESYERKIDCLACIDLVKRSAGVKIIKSK